TFVVEEGIGPVSCEAAMVKGDLGRAVFAVPRLAEPAGAASDTAAIAAGLGLEVADIGFGGFAPARWSAGNAFTFVPLRSLDAVRRAQPDPALFEAALGAGGRAMAYLFCRETVEGGNDFHTRMFAPTFG